MRRFSVPVVVAIAFCLASPVLAADKGAPPAAAPAVSPAPSAEDAKLLGQLVQARAPYQDLLLSGEVFLGEVLAGGNAVLGSPSPPAAADIAAWKAKVLADQAQLRARRAGLGPFPSGQFTKLRTYADGAAVLTGFEKLAVAAGGVADTALAQSDRIIPLVEKAASGDASAREALQKAIVDGTIAALQAENALLEVNTVITGEDAPQTPFSHSMIASNNALIDFYEMIKADGDQARLRALAAKMASDLNEAEAQANKIGPLARYTLAQISKGASPELKSRLEASFATYDDSAKVELQLIALFRQIMTKMIDDPDGAQALSQEIGPLVNRRIELNTERNRLVGG